MSNADSGRVAEGTRLLLGKTGLVVHPLCLGGNVFGWTADEEQSFEVLDAYVEAGGNFVDTADVYSVWVPGHSGGESETVIGRWIEARGNRDDLVIATKVGGRGGLGTANIGACVEASLERLRVDHVDLLYAHLDDLNTPLEESLTAFAGLIESGTVGSIGASNYTAARLEEALAVSAESGLPAFTVFQSHFNALERTRILDPERPGEAYEPALRDVCAQHGLAFIPYWVLAKGFLTGKYRSADGSSGSSRAELHRVGDYAGPQATQLMAAIDVVAEAHGTSAAAVTMAWTAAQPTVTAPMASARTVSQLRDLVTFAGLELSDDELTSITAATP